MCSGAGSNECDGRPGRTHDDVGSGRRTFIETARRAQIVRAAIDTIAALGYANASYAQIAKRAGLSSTGLISYHFQSKDELIEQVVAEVVAAGQAYQAPRVEVADGARGKLRAYIESNIEFMAAHPAHITAVAYVLAALPRERSGQPAPYADLHERGIALLERYMRQGQRSRELRRFDTRVMALAIRAAIDAIAYEIATGPELDLSVTARELGQLFDHAMRSRPDSTNRRRTR
ncbi:MAG TPA: TetR/AcrR family transcriptional regulator [Solirubrobacteraceae bacterium]|nr:TetR/AcrR family transcriptional regulator [Solirubrobacteraceae bacterium]